jgi:hypothetical protein
MCSRAEAREQIAGRLVAPSTCCGTDTHVYQAIKKQ